MHACPRAAFTRNGEYARAMAGNAARQSVSPYRRRLPPVKIILGEAAPTGRAGAAPGGGVSAALELGDEACAAADGGSGEGGVVAR